jgi:phosphomannomutase
MKELKIGTSSVRGVVGDAFTPELVVNFACAFGTWCNGGAVVIGRDTRRSSPTFRAAVIAGLLSTGCEIIDLGICPSPVLSFAVRELGADGGISVTGGHNSARWNALKFIGADGTLLNAVKSEELLDLYHGSAYLLAPWDKIRAVTSAPSIEDRYLEHLLSALDSEKIRERHFRVAVDFCNGSCGPIASRFLEQLGCQLLPVNEQPSGEFAHPPAPSSANMQQLAAIMRWLQADLGTAINVDGDRIGFVTREGKALSEEYALPLAAGIRLKRRPGTVATSLSTSRMIDAIAREHGGRVVRTPVGESHVIDQGLAEDAVLAGEGSGGVAALPSTMMFDGLLTLGYVLESMAVSGDGLSAIVERLPRYVMRKRQLACPPNLVYRVLDRFRARYADLSPNTADGVHVAWDDAWLHVRSSNTEPLLRIIVEAATADRADSLLEDSLTFAQRATFGRGGY